MISKNKGKDYLVKKVWSNKTNYYQKAKKSSENIFSHYGFQIINRYIISAKNILDVGCGEGTKLFQLGSSTIQKTGIDISQDAITKAKKQYPNADFRKADIENIPCANNSFGVTLSAFVLEHIHKPKKVLREMIRVTAKDGYLITICPNFGAPNRHSPCFKDSKIVKLITGLIKQLLFIDRYTIDNWNKVKPLSNGKNHVSDWDTVVEPEIISLIKFLKVNHMKIVFWTSLWEEEVPDANDIQKIFKFLAKLRLYPFKYWGPQLLVISQKI